MRRALAFLALAALAGCSPFQSAETAREAPRGYVWAGMVEEDLVANLRAAGLEGTGCQVRWLAGTFPEWEHAKPPAATLTVILAGAASAC